MLRRVGLVNELVGVSKGNVSACVCVLILGQALMCVCLQQLLSPSNIYEVAVSYFIVSRLKSTAAIPHHLS